MALAVRFEKLTAEKMTLFYISVASQGDVVKVLKFLEESISDLEVVLCTTWGRVPTWDTSAEAQFTMNEFMSVLSLLGDLFLQIMLILFTLGITIQKMLTLETDTSDRRFVVFAIGIRRRMGCSSDGNCR